MQLAFLLLKIFYVYACVPECMYVCIQEPMEVRVLNPLELELGWLSAAM